MKHQWNCFSVSGVSFFRLTGLPSAGQAALIVESGRSSTPFGAPVPMPTAGGAEPAIEQQLRQAPPNEWPMMIGGRSSPRMIASWWSMTFWNPSPPSGVGSARSSSTSTSRPGHGGCDHLVPLAL